MSELVAMVGQPAEAEHEPTFLGLDPGGWVALAMLAVFAIFIWKKVPGAIAKALDDRIALIRVNSPKRNRSARKPRRSRRSMRRRRSRPTRTAPLLLERAKHEAEEIVAKAKTDAEALIGRRTRMAEDKIAAEERAAIEQLRAVAADAATKAAARIIAERHDASTDEKLVDQAIKEIGH